MKQCSSQGIDSISSVVYTGINGKDRVVFGPVARILKKRAAKNSTLQAAEIRY